jgi:NDP-sugar pyrophosphorylase family protein/aminoglycoside/choline kinase family phosphotransferase
MSVHPLTLFLPAAGLGERLRPVTNHLPKPLLPIRGKPIIELTLEKLTAVCDGKIGINLHWKPELIRAWAARSRWSDRITFFPEDPILGTGGALRNAEAFLSSGPFLVHNSDILLDCDFSRLIEFHLSSGNIATLVTHRHPLLSNVVIDDHDCVIDVENPGDSRPDPNRTGRKVAYTGIAVYSPEILKFLPPGVSHATIAWIAAGQAGKRVQVRDVTGSAWTDIGTPASYAAAVLDKVRESGETAYRSPESRCGDISADGSIVIEGASEVRDGSALRNCIVMPGADISGQHANSIIGPDYIVQLQERQMQPGLHAREQKRVLLSDPLYAKYFGAADLSADLTLEADALLIGLGGSDRRYYRVRNNGKSAVLMTCTPDDPDYERHLVYTRFFEAHFIPVPHLIAADAPGRRALFEDLGDTSLYSYLRFPRTQDQIEDIHRSVLDILVKLHGRATEHIHECPMLEERIFDYQYLRWETTYFLDRFVRSLMGAAPRDPAALEGELHKLAQRVDACPKVVIHRDFQSQNIMITGEDLPRVIDFQGARMAPAAYDLASILWDPYERLDDALRTRLFDYYIDEMKEQARGFDERAFLKSLLPCRLQRHMQALGAYGFLSVMKGKKYFLKHVPEALRLLKEETEATKSDYPELYRLVSGLTS